MVALYALLWLRPILVFALPFLPAWLTFGVRPVTETRAAGDVVWVLAVAVSAGMAVAAPKVVPILQDKTVASIPLCGRLLLIEAPVWALLIVTAPGLGRVVVRGDDLHLCGAARLEHPNAVVIAVGGSAALLGALVTRGVGVGDALVEWLCALVLLGLISSSYGLLMPLVLDRLLFAGRRAKTRTAAAGAGDRERCPGRSAGRGAGSRADHSRSGHERA